MAPIGVDAQADGGVDGLSAASSSFALRVAGVDVDRKKTLLPKAEAPWPGAGISFVAPVAGFRSLTLSAAQSLRARELY
jgi:hypothetical protein